MRHAIRIRTLVLSALLLPALARPTGVTGADVLNTRLSARAAGMGEAQVALSDDLSGFAYNPAGLAQLKGPQLGFLHYGQIAGIGTENLGYAHPLSFGTLGLNVVYRGQPDISNPLAQDAPVSAWDIVLAGAYATHPAQWLDGLPESLRESRLGVSVSYVASHLSRYDASTVAVDAGFQTPLGDGFQLGLAALNLGPPIKFIEQSDPLPSTLLGGVERSFEPLWGNQLNVAVDVEAPLQGRLRLHFGGEDWLGKSFALRAGYLLDNGESLNGFTAGFGVRLDQEGLVFMFDYAFRPLYYDGFSSFEPQHLFEVLLGF